MTPKEYRKTGEYDEGHILFVMEMAKLAGIKCTRKQAIRELDILNAEKENKK